MTDPTNAPSPSPLRDPMDHRLKCHPEPFRAIEEERKGFEYRENLDRDFRVGDTLILAEWDPATGEFTGKEIQRPVDYLISGRFGIPVGFCIMSWFPFHVQMQAQVQPPPLGLEEAERLTGVLMDAAHKLGTAEARAEQVIFKPSEEFPTREDKQKPLRMAVHDARAALLTALIGRPGAEPPKPTGSLADALCEAEKALSVAISEDGDISCEAVQGALGKALEAVWQAQEAPGGVETNGIEGAINAIRSWQSDPNVHPLTCGRDSSHELLCPVVNQKGFVNLVCPTCGYWQDWIPKPIIERAGLAPQAVDPGTDVQVPPWYPQGMIKEYDSAGKLTRTANPEFYKITRREEWTGDKFESTEAPTPPKGSPADQFTDADKMVAGIAQGAETGRKPFKAPDCPECGEEMLSGPWSQSCTNPECQRARLTAAMSGSTLLRKSKVQPEAPAAPSPIPTAPLCRSCKKPAKLWKGWELCDACGHRHHTLGLWSDPIPAQPPEAPDTVAMDFRREIDAIQSYMARSINAYREKGEKQEEVACMAEWGLSRLRHFLVHAATPPNPPNPKDPK